LTLESYAASHPAEHSTVTAIRELVTDHSDCFERSCLPGHITASAWILSADHRRFLLTHHRKLGRWLQLGGHADGDGDVAGVALREAREESGMEKLAFLPEGDGAPTVLDLDVHWIPPRPGEPGHFHHDIRFLLVAEPGQALQISEESLDLRWFDWEAFESVAEEESLNRLGRKARASIGAAVMASGICGFLR
jgi:8-oxo-dGTP pyrophosphatase MutT (NUDIX family)